MCSPVLPQTHFQTKTLVCCQWFFLSQSSVWEVRLLQVISTQYGQIKNPPPLIKDEPKRSDTGDDTTQMKTVKRCMTAGWETHLSVPLFSHINANILSSLGDILHPDFLQRHWILPSSFFAWLHCWWGGGSAEGSFERMKSSLFLISQESNFTSQLRIDRELK